MKIVSLITLLLTMSVNASTFKNSLHEQLKKSHKPILSYKEARTYVLGHLYLQRYDNVDRYFVATKYCGFHISRIDFTPGKLPRFKEVQTEHVMPQIRFKRDQIEIQKSDLFNLIPITEAANANRRALEFGYVQNGYILSKMCEFSTYNRTHFEPRDEVKGDIARIMFYMSTRYNIEISQSEESVLREWHELDSVSEIETSLNNRINEIQGNRNPFIDYPEFVRMVDNF